MFSKESSLLMQRQAEERISRLISDVSHLTYHAARKELYDAFPFEWEQTYGHRTKDTNTLRDMWRGVCREYLKVAFPEHVKKKRRKDLPGQKLLFGEEEKSDVRRQA
jgi:hypothetical protein